jgi:hypothetical protein
MEMSDDEIDYSDIPPLDDDLLSKGFVEMPKQTVSVQYLSPSTIRAE